MTVNLYIKQHRLTGLRYFGKTTRDPLKYNGSGLRWRNHIKAHGKNIDTIWTEQFDDAADAVEFAEFFSDFYDIVDDPRWANLKPENSIDGGSFKGHKKSETAKARMSIAKLGKPSGRTTNYRAGIKHSEETIAKMKQAQSGTKNYGYGKHLSEEHKTKIANKLSKPRPQASEWMKAVWAKRKAQQEQQ